MKAEWPFSVAYLRDVVGEAVFVSHFDKRLSLHSWDGSVTVGVSTEREWKIPVTW